MGGRLLFPPPEHPKWYKLMLPLPANVIEVVTFMEGLGYEYNSDFALNQYNSDFALNHTYYTFRGKLIVYLSPEIEQYASWILLNWQPE